MNIIPLFQGFEPPTENWSKLPHALINALPQVTSLAEIKVILYILRHTWGYREFETSKTITGDEFANGRKKSDGTRIDGGIGMSEPSVRTGIKNAIEHGFIVAEVDDSDMARIEKSYKLAMRVEEVGVNSLPSGDKEFTLRTKTINPRSEKETKGKKPKKEKPAPAIHPYIEEWAVVRNIDAINIGAPIFSSKDTASAKRMAKWQKPPTAVEIRTAITSSKIKDYPFLWLETDIPKARLAIATTPAAIINPAHVPFVIEAITDAVDMPPEAREALEQLKKHMLVSDEAIYGKRTAA